MCHYITIALPMLLGVAVGCLLKVKDAFVDHKGKAV